MTFHAHFPSYFNDIMSIGFHSKSPHDTKHPTSGIFLQSTEIENVEEYLETVFEVLIKVNAKLQIKYPQYFSIQMKDPKYPRSKTPLMTSGIIELLLCFCFLEMYEFIQRIKILNMNPNKCFQKFWISL